MQKLYLLIIIFFISCTATNNLSNKNNSIEPNWLQLENRNKYYPNYIYLRGYSSGYKLSYEKLENVSEKISTLAKKELLESIQVEINNESILNINEDVNNKNTTINSNYQINSKSNSKFDIANIIVDKYFEPRTNQISAFAYVKREDVINFYSNIISINLDKIESYINESVIHFNEKRFQKSIQILAQAYNYFSDIDKSRNILNALKVNDESKTQQQRILKNISNLNTKISQSISEEKIILSTNNINYEGEYLEPLNKDIVIKTNFIKSNNTTIANNLPITIFQDSIIFCEGNTDEKGELACIVKKIFSKNQSQFIYAKLNLTKYLSIPENITKLEVFNSLSNNIQFKINVKKVKFNIISNELNIDNSKSNFLESKVKLLLSNNDFVFTSEKDIPKYKITIESKPNYTPTNSEIIFVYLNSTISIIDLKNNIEVFKNSYNIKGGGSEIIRATSVATSKTAKAIEEDLVNWLQNRNAN